LLAPGGTDMPREGRVLTFTGTLTQGADSVQTITADKDAVVGSCKFTIDAVETAAIAFDSTLAQIQAILEAHTSFGAGNVSVTGDTLESWSGTGMVVTGIGEKSGTPIGDITITSATTLKATGNAAITPTVTKTATGVIGSYRGLPTDTVICKTDGIGIAYRNTGTSNKPNWTATEEKNTGIFAAGRNSWGQ
jgi:hypothetical protein